MKKVSSAFMNNLRYVCLIFVVTFGLITIIGSGGGGGGGYSGSDEDSNIGWLEITSSPVRLNAEGEPYAYVNGTAFESPGYIAHKCVGLYCLIGNYDNSYPGVDVTWENKSNNTSGTATSRYGTATDWEHVWYAYIPLILGSNDIVITALDPDGNHSSDSVTVEYPPPDTTTPKVSSTYPADNAVNVAYNTSVTVTFSETMDASSINTSNLALIDGSGNPVSGDVACSDTTATFSPYTNFAYSTTYLATITTGVLDLAGNSMTGDYTWNFTTSGP